MGRVRAAIGWLSGCVAVGAIAVGSLFAFTIVEVLWVRFFDPPGTLTMVQRSVERAMDGEGLDWPSRRVVTLDEMGGVVPRAVLSAEDARFYLHDGFDWDSMCDAVKDRFHGKPLRGASTLTQQVAKNLFLWQGRSWIRKGLEAWYTVLLELLVPKDRILELYLNVAETGPMVFGVEAGANHHYGKSAAGLSADQAGRLAGILPDPRRRSVEGSAARERAAWIRANPAPMPGAPGWDAVLRAWEADGHGPLACLLR